MHGDVVATFTVLHTFTFTCGILHVCSGYIYISVFCIKEGGWVLRQAAKIQNVKLFLFLA